MPGLHAEQVVLFNAPYELTGHEDAPAHGHVKYQNTLTRSYGCIKIAARQTKEMRITIYMVEKHQTAQSLTEKTH